MACNTMLSETFLSTNADFFLEGLLLTQDAAAVNDAKWGTVRCFEPNYGLFPSQSCQNFVVAPKLDQKSIDEVPDDHVAAGTGTSASSSFSIRFHPGICVGGSWRAVTSVLHIAGCVSCISRSAKENTACCMQESSSTLACNSSHAP